MYSEFIKASLHNPWCVKHSHALFDTVYCVQSLAVRSYTYQSINSSAKSGFASPVFSTNWSHLPIWFSMSSLLRRLDALLRCCLRSLSESDMTGRTFLTVRRHFLVRNLMRMRNTHTLCVLLRTQGMGAAIIGCGTVLLFDSFKVTRAIWVRGQ